ncbi:hypothetical protein OSB04_005946 [Centaurea solstitialis]|uniref:Uncharacterized protein n=1 Tax=Centaurea solstitialis TaxID=347529 RepID=A0AA38TSJ6_9ASTR|nr:hypothetical protein OSB04_005946 [Centaurea solstitialis]
MPRNDAKGLNPEHVGLYEVNEMALVKRCALSSLHEFDSVLGGTSQKVCTYVPRHSCGRECAWPLRLSMEVFVEGRQRGVSTLRCNLLDESGSLPRFSKIKDKPESFPFNYLGLPVGGNMAKSANGSPVIDKFKSRLSSWKAKSLSLGGRLCLCKSVLGSLGTSYFSLYKAQIKVVNTHESIRRCFFWGGTDNSKKICWVTWEKILRDKNNGGLGIGSLRALNLAMLAKWWWRERTEPSAKWLAVIRSCSGSNSADTRRSNRGTWSQVISIDKHLRELGVNLNSLLRPNSSGSGWVWHLEDSKVFTVSSLRRLIDCISLPAADPATLWIKWVRNKANTHLWRTLINRLVTLDNLAKRVAFGYLPYAENLNHLFVECSTTRLVSVYLVCWLDWWPDNESSVSGLWEAIGANSSNVVHTKVKQVIATSFFWTIWLHRNNKAFTSSMKNEKVICRDIQFLAYDWIRVDGVVRDEHLITSNYVLIPYKEFKIIMRLKCKYAKVGELPDKFTHVLAVSEIHLGTQLIRFDLKLA